MYGSERSRPDPDFPMPVSYTHLDVYKRQVVKYTLPENETQIFASKYKLYLPSEEELLQELQREYRALEYDKEKSN